MIQIRNATLEDAAALSRVESASFPEAEACSLENFKKRLAVFSDYFLVLEDEGEICALIDGMVTDQETITDELYEDATLHNPDGAWQSVFGLAVMPRLLAPPDPELVLRPLAGVEPLSFGMYYKTLKGNPVLRRFVELMRLQHGEKA